ncbi:MAG TPA: hypothetical protein VFZ46_00680 [Nitrososphaeraceae archaeon]
MGIAEILKRKKNQESNEIKCKICNIIFQDKEHLSRHNKKAHGKEDDFLPTSNPFQV